MISAMHSVKKIVLVSVVLLPKTGIKENIHVKYKYLYLPLIPQHYNLTLFISS